MKEISYNPKDLSADCPFEGKITLKVPSYKERLEMIKQLNFKVGGSGEMEPQTSKMDSAIDMVDLLEKHIACVDLKASDGSEVKSVDELGYWVEGAKLINDLANILLGGIKLGKA